MQGPKGATASNNNKLRLLRMQKCCRSAGAGASAWPVMNEPSAFHLARHPQRDREGDRESKNNNNDNNRLAKRGDDSGLLVRVFRLFPSPSPSPSTSLLCSVSRLVSRSALNASRRPTNNFLLAFWTDVLASNAAVVAPAAVPICLSALLLLFCFLLLISHNHFTSHVYKCVCVCV